MTRCLQSERAFWVVASPLCKHSSGSTWLRGWSTKSRAWLKEFISPLALCPHSPPQACREPPRVCHPIQARVQAGPSAWAPRSPVLAPGWSFLRPTLRSHFSAGAFPACGRRLSCVLPWPLRLPGVVIAGPARRPRPLLLRPPPSQAVSPLPSELHRCSAPATLDHACLGVCDSEGGTVGQAIVLYSSLNHHHIRGHESIWIYQDFGAALEIYVAAAETTCTNKLIKQPWAKSPLAPSLRWEFLTFLRSSTLLFMLCVWFFIRLPY